LPVLCKRTGLNENYMADEIKTYSKCEKCFGTGICTTYNAITEEPVIEDPCVNCGGEGYFEIGKMDVTDLTDKVEMLQTSLDQVAGVVKSSSEYIEKIYKIVSKEK